ncbi:MAG TPA: FAD-dependent oxidoreductase [Thermoanaerobaculia bacterium]|jgi:NADH dehydrogenase FAD-containing subunit
MDKLVILGGGYAGTLAAVRIARHGHPVTLIDARDGMAERIRMHQAAAGDDIPLLNFSRLFRKLPVDVIRTRVESIDRQAKRIVTADGAVEYDKLIYALGSVQEKREHTLSVEDPCRVREQLQHAKSVIVVGAGLTGIELATEIAERHPHLHVTLVEGGSVGAALSGRAARYLRETFEAMRITLLEQTRVAGTVAGGIVLGNGETLHADVILWCGSFRLSPIAAEAGLEVNGRGQIVVDEFLRSSDPSIWAAGDAAQLPDARMGCVTAMALGAYAADSVIGTTREPFRFAFGAMCISLGRHAGLIQLTHDDDSPRDTFISGRAGAWVKELICRYTVLSIRLEAIGIPYNWPKGDLRWNDLTVTA